MRFRASAVSVIAAAGMLLSGCTMGPLDKASESASANRVATLGQPAAKSTELTPLGTPDEAPKTQRPEASAQLAVTGVRVGSHKRFDRVVVDLSGPGDPGWYVDYVSAPMQETVGKPLNVQGSAFLNINVDGTIYPFEAGIGSVPVDPRGGSSNIVDVVNGGTSEGRSQVVVGLRSEKPYSVQVLHDPTRLVVDILKS